MNLAKNVTLSSQKEWVPKTKQKKGDPMKKGIVWTICILLFIIILYGTFTDYPGARFIGMVIGKIFEWISLSKYL